MKTIIFLDIDGVIQPYKSENRFGRKLDDERNQLAVTNPIFATMHSYDIGAARYDWHTEAIEILRRLCDIFDAHIVITSAWRSFNNLQQMKALFSFYHLEDRVIDCAEQLDGSSRSDEVKKYLEDHPDIEQFVVIDDQYYHDFLDFCPDNFVDSDKSYLREEHFERAKMILEGKIPPKLKRYDGK
jgi:hypothetical protein